MQEIRQAKWERFGQDEWVAREEARRATGVGGWVAHLERTWQQLNPRLQVLVLVALAAMLPLVTRNAYVMRVAGLTGLYVMLALGLNIVAGFAGLLDLGYVAFYGLGAYAYALLASPHFDFHVPFWFALPLITLVIGLLGRVLGTPSLRLRGDYLAKIGRAHV
jgi:ABC-type branched-subunit amino acid transport system permease subunit